MWNFNDLDAVASQPASNGSTPLRNGTYAFSIEGILETKSGVGDMKYEVTLKVKAAADKSEDMIGITKKQHFVVGHSKKEVAAGYQRDFLAMVKAAGCDLTKVTNAGEMYMALKDLETKKAVVKYAVEAQAKDPKYYNWRLIEAKPITVIDPPIVIEDVKPVVTEKPKTVAPVEAAQDEDPLF